MRHLIMPLLAATAASVLSTAPVYADLGDQLFKLLADDGAAHDFFGYSVAISGPRGNEIAIVGAWGDDDNGGNSGSAYLFDVGDPKDPVQIAKLLPADGFTGDFFGRSVAISRATAIVGAPRDNDNGENSGSAYLFDTTTGRQIAKLLPDDGSEFDIFGTPVAISGPRGSEVAIVGAAWDDDNGHNSGSAYLFDATTGRQLFKLLPDDGSEFDIFGVSVAISGAIAIVGARADDDNGANSGSAYLFDICDPANPKQLFKFLPNDGAQGDNFGHSVAINRAPGKKTAILGAFLDDDNGPSSGSAYLFDTTTGRQIAKLLPNDGAKSDRFGISVAISGTTAIVGAWQHGDNGLNSGSAYLFDTTTGQQIDKLLPDDGAVADLFGISVAISGAPGKEFAVVGARLDDDNGTDSGSAYLFDAAATPGKCPWDLDDNGIVGISDLLTVLAAWGTDPGGPPDFDGDGSVGETDLAALLANWGPCP